MVLSYRTVEYVYTSNLSSLGEVVGSEIDKEFSQFMIVTHCWQSDRLEDDSDGEGNGEKEEEEKEEKEEEDERKSERERTR